MFAGFGNFMDKLHPCNDVISAITGGLGLDKESYGHEEKVKAMKKDGFCEINDVKSNLKELNKSLSGSPVVFSEVSFGGIYIYFPKTYAKDGMVIKLSDIYCELVLNQDVKPPSKDEKKNEKQSNPLESIINMVVSKLRIEVNRVRLVVKINDISYTIMIKSIIYDKIPGKEIESKDKLKFLFCHLKRITLSNFLIKESHDDKDKVFYNDEENEDQIKFYTSKDIMFFTNNAIELDIAYDPDNSKLTLVNDKELNKVNFECLLYIDQIKTLLSALNEVSQRALPKDQKEEKKEEEKEEEKKEEEKTDFKVLNIPLHSVEVKMNFDFCYLLVGDCESKPKFWLIYSKYFGKFITYDSNINLLQNHFCYLGNIFYFIYFEKFALGGGVDILESKKEVFVEVKKTVCKMVQPNKVESKKNIIYVNTGGGSNNEKCFSDLFTEHYLKVVKFCNYTHEIFDAIDLRYQTPQNKLSVDVFNVIANALVIKKLLESFDFMNQKKSSSSTNFTFEGNINLRIIVNKRSSKYIKNKTKDIESDFYQEQIIVSLVELILKKTPSDISVQYKKSMCWFIMNSIVYPLLLNFQKENQLISYATPNGNIDFSVDKIILFINPSLLNYVVTFAKIVNYSFQPLLSKSQTDETTNQAIFKFYNKFTTLSIDEFSLIFFSHLSFKNAKIDIKKINQKSELIFRFIANPFLKAKILNIEKRPSEFDIEKVEVLVHKQDNSFQNETSLYNLFIGDRAKQSFELLLYNASETNKMCTVNIIPESSEIKVSLDNIVICPISKAFEEILIIFEYSKREYVKMTQFLASRLPLTNEMFDITTYETFYSKNPKQIEEIITTETQHFTNPILSLSLKKLYVDIFSIYKKKVSYNSNTFIASATSQKDRMRLITQIEIVEAKSINFGTFDFSVKRINSIMLKDLDIHPQASAPIKENVETHFYFGIGFADLISLNKISISCKKDFAQFSLDSVNVNFCSDSLQYFIGFIDKVKKDFTSISSLFTFLDDDKESLMTDPGPIQERLLIDQLKNRPLDGSGIEFRSIGRAQSETKNFNFKFAKTSKTPSLNSSGTGKSQTKPKKQQVKLNPLPSSTEINKTPIEITDDTKKVIFNILIVSFTLNLYAGSDFDFQSKYESDVIVVEKNNPRRTEEGVWMILNKVALGITIVKGTVLISSYCTVDSLIVHDHIPQSKFSKIASMFDFENQSSLLMMKTDLIKSLNGNGENDLNTVINLAPISIYIDQKTLAFLLEFFEMNTPSSFTQNNIELVINTPNDVMTEEVSAMNYSQYKRGFLDLNISTNPENFYMNKMQINPFFISLTYNSGKADFSNFSPKIKNALYLLNMFSFDEMKIEFKEYTNSKRFKAKKMIDELYSYYVDDILNDQVKPSYFKALPFIKGVCEVLEGTLDLAYCPIENYKENTSIQEGMVKGVRKFVVSTSCGLLSLGESISGMMQGFCCVPRQGESIYRTLRYKIDDESKKRDEYYLKQNK